MENRETKKKCPGSAVQATRLDRVTAKMERLKRELTQARARRQEEAARQDRIAKLRERQRIESEQRYLGRLCRMAGLDNFRHSQPAERSEIPPLDADLIAGALQLLAQQVRECSEQDLQQLRVRGRSLQGNAQMPEIAATEEPGDEA